jgi:hypothetical protein
MAEPYDSLLAQDDTLQAALTAIGQEELSDRAALIAAGQSQLIPYGQIPDFPQTFIPSATVPGGQDRGTILNDIADPLTRQLAQQATQSGVSTVAQAQHAQDVNYANMIGSLTGRGAIRSGAFASHDADLIRQFNLQNFTDKTTLMNALGTSYTGYLNALAGRRQERSDAVNAALGRAIAKIQAGISLPGLAPTDPNVPPGYVPPSPFQINSPQAVDPTQLSDPGAPDYPTNQVYTPVYVGSNQTFEPKITDTNAYADVSNPVAPPSTPTPKPAAPSEPYLQSQPTPEVRPPKPAAPTVPVIGYGGGRTSGQVKRNQL